MNAAEARIAESTEVFSWQYRDALIPSVAGPKLRILNFTIWEIGRPVRLPWDATDVGMRPSQTWALKD